MIEKKSTKDLGTRAHDTNGKYESRNEHETREL